MADQEAALNIGVLALQGAFREHRRHLEGLGAAVREVRLPADLAGLDGLVMPGGESTTMARLMTEFGLWEPVRAFHARGGALWGTCAGAILLAREVQGAPPQFGGHQDSLKLLDMTVRRNAFGRQIDSFTTTLEVASVDKAVPAVFIRAPAFVNVGPECQVLATFQEAVVMVQRRHVLATAFHPELTADSAIHRYFLTQVVNASKTVSAG